jgi:uncharacterized protein
MPPDHVKPKNTLRVGLISDTHGLLRPEATASLQGCDHILHGGDIGAPDILKRLATLAPVTAVRGNNDTQAWASSLPHTQCLQLGGATLYVIHDLSELDIDPGAAGVQVVVSGHSHKPSVQTREGVLYVNPGSAGPRRFKLPIALGDLRIRGGRITPRWIELPLS